MSLPMKKAAPKLDLKQKLKQEQEHKLVARNLAQSIIKLRNEAAEIEAKIKAQREELEAVTGYTKDVPKELAQQLAFPGVGTVARVYVGPKQSLNQSKLVENLTRLLKSGEKATQFIELCMDEKPGYSYLDVRAEKEGK